MSGQGQPELFQTICLHHNDTDGRASAAIIRKALGNDVWLYEMNYGDLLPLEKIFTADKIIIVDFSLPKDEMVKLAAYHDLTWIDHHQSAIDDLQVVSVTWHGIRNPKEAACVLTWKYYFPNDPVPKAITLIGDRDVWRWAEQDTGAFNEGLFQLDTRPLNDNLWKPLLNNDTEILQKIISNGKVLRKARLREIRRTILCRGFPVYLDGHKTLALNIRGSGDIGEQVRSMGYAIAYCYVDNIQNGELITFVTLYSKDIDVSKIAIRFGGGGHAGAAGFNFKRGISPFPPRLHVDFATDD